MPSLAMLDLSWNMRLLFGIHIYLHLLIFRISKIFNRIQCKQA
uniref:ATP synthase F0 subunit 8 n=1 Tax=Romanomermis culicivorax TaxID=13658 RepID=A0A915KL84_ROMCU